MSEDKWRKQMIRGPAPFASFDDNLLDDNNEVAIQEENSPKKSLMPQMPRIDISHASSLSQQDESFDNPDMTTNENSIICNDTEFLNDEDFMESSKLAVAFKEDSTLDLRSSTEDLMFEDPLVASRIRGSRSNSPTHLKIESELVVISQHRKDSQCSDTSFLPISGRTSRLSSYGSRLSINSNRSDISRSSSPGKLLLETSFCVSALSLNSPQASPSQTVSIAVPSVEKNEESRLPETDAYSLKNPPKAKKGETAFIFIPLKGPVKRKFAKNESMKLSMAEQVFGSQKKKNRKGQKQQPVRFEDSKSKKDIIRIKLKPDHLYDDVVNSNIENCSNNNANNSSNEMNEIEQLRQEIAPFERSKFQTNNNTDTSHSLSPNELPTHQNRSRKNSFTNLIKNTFDVTTTQIAKRASLSNIFKSSSGSTSNCHISNNKKTVEKKEIKATKNDLVIRIPLKTPSMESENLVEEISKQVQEMCNDLNNFSDRESLSYKPNTEILEDDTAVDFKLDPEQSNAKCESPVLPETGCLGPYTCTNDGSEMVDSKDGNEIDAEDLDNDDKESNSDSTTSHSLKVSKMLAETQSSSELKTLMLQEESSFDDELIYVPTTLPMERSMAIPIVPVKSRIHHLDKLTSIERPRSSSLVKQNLNEYDFARNFQKEQQQQQQQQLHMTKTVPFRSDEWIGLDENAIQNQSTKSETEVSFSEPSLVKYSFAKNAKKCNCECHDETLAQACTNSIQTQDEEELPLLTDDDSN